MKKLGLFGVLLVLFPNLVYGYSYNKTVSNPYQIATYNITDISNNTVYNASGSDDGTMYTLSFNNSKEFRFTANITFLSDASESSLDIGDASLLYYNDSDLLYWSVPICVNKLDFTVSMQSANCPACMQKNNDVTILFDDDNTCSFVDENFVGPVKYLSDPGKGTRAFLQFKVKEYRIPNTLLTATANDRFFIKNNNSDYPLVFRFLNTNTQEGGLYDLEGISSLSLRTKSRDVAMIQSDSVNNPYKCSYSYNLLNIDSGNYFLNDTLTLSSSLPKIRNLNESNYLKSNPTITSGSGTGISFSENNDGSIVVNGTANGNVFIRFDSNFTLPNGNYVLSDTYVNSGTYLMCQIKHSDNTYLLPAVTSSGIKKFSVIDGDIFDFCQLRISSGTTLNNLVVKPMINKGNNLIDYEPYFVHGFNNDISQYNSASFNFTESNLNSKGKVRACVKYKDDVTNEYNVSCHDFIAGSSSLYYNTEWFNYSTCPSPFVFLCGRKMPQIVQFQLLDNNSYYFKNPLLYSQDVEWSNFFGYVGSNDKGLVTPTYVPPKRIICNDINSGVTYDYQSRTVLYDENSSSFQFDKSVVQQNQINSILGGYDLPEHFGLSGLIDIPINFIQTIRTGTCNPINLSFKIKNNNVNALSLPCGSSFWNRQDLSEFRPFLSTFFTGYIVYSITYAFFFWLRNKRDPIKITNSDGEEELMVL